MQVFLACGAFSVLPSRDIDSLALNVASSTEKRMDGCDAGGTVDVSVLLSSPASILSFSPSCVCVSRGSRLTPDPELMRAITRIKRGWLQGVRVWGLNNYTLLPTCFSSWLRKLQPPPTTTTTTHHTLSASIQKKGLMENNKLSRGHVNLDVNRQAIMF